MKRETKILLGDFFTVASHVIGALRYPIAAFIVISALVVVGMALS